MSLSKLAPVLIALKKRPYLFLYVMGVAVILSAGYLWWTRVYLSPTRVFWGMIDNSLTTAGVTTRTSQTINQGTVTQLMQFEVGSKDMLHSVTTLHSGSTDVKTEVI